MIIDEDGIFDVQSDHNVVVAQICKPLHHEARELNFKFRWRMHETTDWEAFANELKATMILWEDKYRSVEDRGENCVEKMEREWSALVTEAAKNTIGVYRPRRTLGNSKKPDKVPKRIKTAIMARRLARRRQRTGKKRHVSVEEQRKLKKEVRRTVKAVKEEKKAAIAAAREEFARKVDGSQIGAVFFWKYWAKLKKEVSLGKKTRLLDGTGAERIDREATKLLTAHMTTLNSDESESESVYYASDESVPVGVRDITRPVTELEIIRAIGQLQTGKAMGEDRVPNEFLKKGQYQLVSSLKTLFNHILSTERFPSAWKRSRIQMLHKGGDKRVLDNYRGICISSNVGKLFVKILGARLDRDVEQRDLLGDVQFGFRKGKRTTDALFILSALLEKQKKSGKKIAMAFLDIKKAYDRVDRTILWRTLSKLGYGGKFLRVLQSLYKDISAVTSLNELQSDPINLKKGLRQGCVLSPLLFALYIKDVGDALIQSKCGVEIEGIKIPALFFADDMVLMAPEEKEMNKLLEITYKVISEKKLSFNAAKCKVLVSWRDTANQSPWHLGPDVIHEATSYRYLGVPISLRGKTFRHHFKSQLCKIRGVAKIIKNVARSGINATTLTKNSWESIGLAISMYAAEICWPTQKHFGALNGIQNQLARFALGVSSRAPVDGMRGLLGWTSIEAQWAKVMLSYYRRFEFEAECWGKKIWQGAVIRKSTWYKTVSRLSDKYNVDLNHPTRSYRTWKGYVKERIFQTEIERWLASCGRKQTLKIAVRSAKDWGDYPCMDGSWGSKCLNKLRLGDINTVNRRRHYEKESIFHCLGCGKAREDTLEHNILSCDGAGEARKRISTAFGEEYNQKEDLEKARWLLGCSTELSSGEWAARHRWAASLMYSRNRTEPEEDEKETVYVVITQARSTGVGEDEASDPDFIPGAS